MVESDFFNCVRRWGGSNTGSAVSGNNAPVHSTLVRAHRDEFAQLPQR